MYRTAVVAIVILAMGSLAATCDCLFQLEGRVVECGTTTPVAGAPIAIRVDRGFRGRQRVVTEESFSTNDDGRFRIGINEPCRSWVTFTFSKEGFNPLEIQYKGAPEGAVELCMTRASSP